MVSPRRIPYLLTCCGQSLIENRVLSKHNDIHLEGSKVWERLKELRSPPIRHPLVDTLYNDKEFTPYEFLSRKEVWQEESLGVLAKAPRTYLDMVVTTPGRNLRILFKIIDGFKCDIFWQFLRIHRWIKSNRTSISRLESHCYKELLEYYDLDNPPKFRSMLLHAGEVDEDTYR